MSFFPELPDPATRRTRSTAETGRVRHAGLIGGVVAWQDDEEEETEPTGPILWPQGGGGDLETRHGYWLWPAPLAGDLQIVAQWLEQGIAECRVTIPAPLLADAARRIVEVWPDDVLGGPA